MKWLAWIVVVLVGLIALIGVVGLLLPVRHVAAVRIHIRQPPERIFDVISDVAGAAEWRSDVERVEILSAPPAAPRWRETTGAGTLVMAVDESSAPSRFVTRIDDPGQPFGGRWIHELVPASDGTTVTITEEGEVYNPFFRFMSRFVFGHTATMDAALKKLRA